MEKIYLADIAKHDGKEVLIEGWVYNIRSSGKIKFLIVRDGTGLIQAVAVKNELEEKYFNDIDKLTQESSLRIWGSVRAEKRAPGGWEMTLKGLEIIHISEEYPISLKDHGVAFLMDNRHLWIRSEKQRQILKIRAEVIQACRQFYYERGFTLIDSPILTPAACEGTTTLFETDYFDGKAYLSQSGQLYLEPALAAFGKVYCFGPAFRAEKSKTRKHLQEFWIIEPEVAFAEHEDNIRLAEEFITYIVQWVLDKARPQLQVLERDISKLEKIKPPFARFTYDEVIIRLQKEGRDLKWGDDFGAEEETLIGNWAETPVVIEKHPANMKAFYMQPDEKDPRYVLSMDVFAPEGYGEIIGGSQRDANYERLLKKIQEQKLPVEAFEWYLDVRRYGSVPHSGFGMGLERVVSWITGASHIRETIPYPRMLYRLYP
jgi:asparaginyl-tRNA synthetase